jgi:hypothetical protein
METTICTWSDVTHSGDGSIAYRVIGEAPFDGIVVTAFFVPDKDVQVDATKRWVIDLINAGADGSGDTAITEAWSTGAAVTALEVIDFDPAAPVGEGALVVDPLAVEAGDLIVWRAVQEIDAGAANSTASARPTGWVKVYIEQAGGS